MYMTYGENTVRIVGVIKRCVDVPSEMLAPANWHKPLTGAYFNFSTVDLIYLLFELEIEFCIRIPSDLLSNYRFSSISKICEAIQACQ